MGDEMPALFTDGRQDGGGGGGGVEVEVEVGVVDLVVVYVQSISLVPFNFAHGGLNLHALCYVTQPWVCPWRCPLSP